MELTPFGPTWKAPEANFTGDVFLHVRQGDIVWTSSGEEHWHGAGPTTLMAHIATLNDTRAGDAIAWFEPVDDDTDRAAQR